MEYSADVHEVLKYLAKRGIQTHRVLLIRVDKVELIARETGIVPKELYITLQDTLSYRTRACLKKQPDVRRVRADSEIPPPTTPTPPPEGSATTVSGSGEGSEGG